MVEVIDDMEMGSEEGPVHMDSTLDDDEENQETSLA